MKIIKRIQPIVLHLHFLLFINGFLIAGFLFFRLQADYENRLFDSLAREISNGQEKASQDSLLKKALHTTHHLLEARSRFFYSGCTSGLLDDIVHPVSADMMTAEGACGSYSTVLSRLLASMGFTTRFAQMKSSDGQGAHIIIEAFTRHGWVVLDPKFDLCFTQPNGKLASFTEIAANWPWYTQQLPAGYKMQYNYKAVQYTNWHKIPILMPALRKTLSLFMPEEQLQQVSLRSYFLNKYAIGGYLLLFFIVPVSLLILVKLSVFKYFGPVRFKVFTPEFVHTRSLRAEMK